MSDILITNIIKFEIVDNPDACQRILALMLSGTDDGNLLLKTNLRGGYGGQGNHLSYFLPEARPALERFIESEKQYNPQP